MAFPVDIERRDGIYAVRSITHERGNGRY